MSNPTKQFNTITGKTLMSQPIEPLGFTVESILPHGLFILSGSSKIGKSWLALDLCYIVASGGQLWGYATAQGEVLYLALEDTPKRMRERLSKIAPDYDFNSPGDIHFVHRSHKLGDGLAEQISAFLDKHPQTKLIVIDTLQYIRNTGKFNGTYSGDYHDMDALREIIRGRKLTMLLITHNHKSNESDPINKVYGSAGLTGAVDGIFVMEKLRRTDSIATLTIANRDTESHEFDLRFDKQNCRWQYLEEVSDMGSDDDEDELFEMLMRLLNDENPTWKGTITELHLDLTYNNGTFYMPSIIMAKTLRHRQDYLLSNYGITCTLSGLYRFTA
jgi:hypothetical protein